jgi:hypothetical protein
VTTVEVSGAGQLVVAAEPYSSLFDEAKRLAGELKKIETAMRGKAREALHPARDLGFVLGRLDVLRGLGKVKDGFVCKVTKARNCPAAAPFAVRIRDVKQYDDAGREVGTGSE